MSWSNEGKVGYVTLRGLGSKAYIDLTTGVGTDKYTDEPVVLEWDAKAVTWRQIA